MGDRPPDPLPRSSEGDHGKVFFFVISLTVFFEEPLNVKDPAATEANPTLNNPLEIRTSD